jgi:hypothetical protein
MTEAGNLLEKITDPMTIMIRVVGFTAGCFWFLWEFIGFVYFFRVSTYILRGFTWRFQKEASISNSNMHRYELFMECFLSFIFTFTSFRPS